MPTCWRCQSASGRRSTPALGARCAATKTASDRCRFVSADPAGGPRNRSIRRAADSRLAEYRSRNRAAMSAIFSAAFLERAAAPLVNSAAARPLNLAAIGQGRGLDRRRLQGAGLHLPVRRQRLHPCRPISHYRSRASFAAMLSTVAGQHFPRLTGAPGGRQYALAPICAAHPVRRRRHSVVLNVSTTVQPTSRPPTPTRACAAAQALLAWPNRNYFRRQPGAAPAGAAGSTTCSRPATAHRP